jgi:drug/metabolite transporter (DMT)-like permease
MNVRTLALWAAAGTGVQVGAAMVATRYVVDATGPASLGFLRYAIGFLCLVPALLLQPRQRIARRDVLPIGLLGVGQFGLLIVLLNFSLQHIPAARASLLFSTFPLMTLLLSVGLRRDVLTLAKAAGSALCFAGVAVALGGDALAPAVAGQSPWLGAVAALAAAFCGAACSVGYRPYVARYSALYVTALAMLIAVGFLAILAVGEGFFSAWPRFTLTEWAAVIFIGVSSGIGFFLWVYALGNAPPLLVTMFLGLSPVTAALGGTLLLGEAMPIAALIGLGCVIAGLGLALRASK